MQIISLIVSISIRHADDTTLMEENEEELKSFLMKIKEESGKAGLKLNSKKNKTKQNKQTNKKKRLWQPFPPLHGK